MSARDKYYKKGQLHYRSQTYKNPFFAKQRTKINWPQKIQINWRFKLFAVIFFIALFVIIYFIFYSNYFAVKTINIEGDGRIPSSTVENLAWRQIEDNFFIFWPQKNIFLFSKDKLIKTLNTKYAFSFLEITKKPPSTILIKYKEKEYALIWEEKGKYFYADKYGNIISEINAEEASLKNYPIIENQTNFLIQNKKISAGDEYLKYALNLASEIREYDNLPNVEKYIIDHELNTIKLKFKNGPLIYFDIKATTVKQIRKLLVLKNEKIGSAFSGLTYIDLRYGDSVYYR